MFLPFITVRRRNSIFRCFLPAGFALLVWFTTAEGTEKSDAPPSPWKDIVELNQKASTPEEVEEARRIALIRADSLIESHDDSSASIVLNMAGQLLFREGKLEEAVTAWERGLGAAGRVHYKETEASLLNSLAIGAGAQGEYETSARRFNALTAIRIAMGDSSGTARAWHNMALCYRMIGRIPEALRANQESMTLFDRTGDEKLYIRGSITRADLLHDLGRDEEAIVWSDSALSRLAGSSDPHATGVALGNRTQYLISLGRQEEALATIDNAIAALGNLGQTLNVIDLEFDRATILFSLGRFNEALAEVRRLAPEFQSRPEEIHQISLPVLEGNALLSLGKFKESEEVLRVAVDRVEKLRSGQSEEASRAGITGIGNLAYTVLADLHAKCNRPVHAWQVAERARGPVFRNRMSADGREADIISLSDLQAALAASRSTLLHYNDPRDGAILVFIIAPDTLIAKSLPLNGRDFIHDVRNTIGLLSRDLPEEMLQPPLDRLAAQIVTPLLPFLPGETERLLIIPPSTITGFPWEALPTARKNEEGKRLSLGDRYPISYLPSATAIGLIATYPDSIESMMIAFADPAGNPADGGDGSWHDSYRSLRGTPLPEARLEAELIVPAGGLILTGKDATRARALSTEMDGAAVLHFATHALINPLHPQSSALLLAGSGADEGLLTTKDIESRRLNADLVTLSGCRTNGGYAYLGEGTYGFPRAFLIAGARSVVTSLWEVEDSAARRFMELFYSGLAAGIERDRCLQEARMEMAREGYSHRDRSAFVLTGIGHEPVRSLAEQGSESGPFRPPRMPVIFLALFIIGIILIRNFRKQIA